MVRDPFVRDEAPDLQQVLDSLDDEVCRTLIQQLEEPMTANELSTAADVPLSTTYRKLEKLSQASLLATRTELRRGGHHRTRYRVDFEEVSLWLDERREFDVSVVRPPEAPDERLATLWGEIRRET